MKRIAVLPLMLVLAGCATALTKGGAQVRVFGLDEAVPDAMSAVPEACRLLGATPEFDQEESERAVLDPYAKQRNAVAALGGNVLLVASKVIIRQPSTTGDCSPGSRTQECLSASQTWYHTSFRYYACTPEAVGRLESDAESSPRKGPLFTWTFGGSSASRTSVAQLKSKILAMMHEDVGTDVIVAYVKGEHLKEKLSSNDIIDWKKAGIDEKVIEAVVSP